jgi:HlyD family secretion protein
MKRIVGWIQKRWEQSMVSRAMLVAPPVALVLLAGFMTYNRPRVEYYTRTVDRGPIEQVVSATGTINAVTTVQVGSQVSGNIAALYADFNSKVKKGQVIAQIDPATFRARLLQAEADLENARANVKSLEAQIETQRADTQASKAGVERARAQLKEAALQLKRTKELAEQGIISLAQLDTAQATHDTTAASLAVAEAQYQQALSRLKVTQAQADQARAQVAQRKAAAEMARVDLGHTTIVAPIDGTVIARNVDVGQTVAASLQAPTLFVIAQDLTKMLVYAKTDEADVGKIRVGATARFRVDSFPRREFTGKVTQVRMNATTVQNVVTYDTIIEFDNPNQMLFPGMTAYVTIPVEFVEDAIRVPNGALRFKPDISEEELKALYTKHNIPYEDPRRRVAATTQGSAGGGANSGPEAMGGGTAATGRGPGGAEGGGGRQWRKAGGAAAGAAGNAPGSDGSARRMDRCQVVWRLAGGKGFEPVCIRAGVTDFTFTEVRDGNLKEGDKVVIGVSSGRQAQNTPTRPGAPQSPMGGPGGFPRRM